MDRRASGRRPLWAKALSLLGELCLLAGAFVGLYLVWQLVWLPTMSSRAAERAVAEISWTSKTERVGTPRYDDPPPAASFDAPKTGDLLGVLHVPRFGDGWARGVYEGVGRARVLDPLGIGHYPDLGSPGQIGNFALAGHRTTYSRPFHDIDQLQPGDTIVFETADVWYVYTVNQTPWVVRASDNRWLAPLPGDRTWKQEPTERLLTMTACHPKGSRSQRIIAQSTFDHWIPKSDGAPAALVTGTSGSSDQSPALVAPGSGDVEGAGES